MANPARSNAGQFNKILQTCTFLCHSLFKKIIIYWLWLSWVRGCFQYQRVRGSNPVTGKFQYVILYCGIEKKFSNYKVCMENLKKFLIFKMP